MLVLLQLKLKQLAFNVAKQQALLEDIATLLEDGVPLTQTVDTIRKIDKGINVEVADAIIQAIAQGKHFAEGLKGWFAPHIIELIRAGEEGGSLIQTLQAAAKSLRQTHDIANTLVNSLLYPMIIIGMTLAIAIYLNHSIFKDFVTIKPIEAWPQNAKNLVTIASFIEQWWWLGLIFISVLIWLASRFLRNYIGHLRQYIDCLPVISLYRKLFAARLMENLGVLIANGVVFKNALRILQYSASPYLASHLLSMEYRLVSGHENLAEVMDTGLIDKPIIQRLQAVALSRNYEHALARQGQLANVQIIGRVKLIGRVASGLLMMVAAVLAAYILVSIYTLASSI